MDRLRPRFAAVGAVIPDEVAVSWGRPSQNGRARPNRVVGECWNHEASAAGLPDIFLFPVFADSVEVAGPGPRTHPRCPPGSGRKERLKRSARGLDRIGRMTATTASDQLRPDLHAMAGQIGQSYPHGEIHAPANERKQSTRMLKLSAPGCGYPNRTTRNCSRRGSLTAVAAKDFEVKAPSRTGRYKDESDLRNGSRAATGLRDATATDDIRTN